MTVLLNIPDPDDPGFLLRQEAVFDLQIASMEAMADYQEMQGNIAQMDTNPGAVDYRKIAEALTKARKAVTKQVEYILGYVVKPEDRDEAREAIKNLSKNELRKVMDRIREGASDDAENPTD